MKQNLEMIPNAKYRSKKFTFLWGVLSWLKKLSYKILRNRVIKVLMNLYPCFSRAWIDLSYSVFPCTWWTTSLLLFLCDFNNIGKIQVFLLKPVLFILNLFSFATFLVFLKQFHVSSSAISIPSENIRKIILVFSCFEEV